MRSMTGYGCGESVHDGSRITVELSSVNRRQAEITLNVPRDLELLEPRIREEVGRWVARGRVTVRVAVRTDEGRRASNLRINRTLATAYVREWRALAGELGLSDGITLDLLLRAPGVIETHDETGDTEAYWPPIAEALATALRQLVQMRELEGANLVRDMSERLALLRTAVETVRQRAPGVVEQYRRQLHERIAGAGVVLTPDDQERLMKEIALFADRSDITEELTRLQSHCGQFQDCLSGTEPAGRTLDFLAQEMNREVNTIGSKANDALIAREVVAMKAELERLREQSQNLE